MTRTQNLFFAMTFAVAASLALTGCLEALDKPDNDAGTSLCPSGRPVLSIVDKDKSATEGVDTGSFLVTRDQDTGWMTGVFEISGADAARYELNTGTNGWAVVFEPDEMEKEVVVTAVNNTADDGDTTLHIVPAVNSDFDLDEQEYCFSPDDEPASVTIHDNDNPPPACTFNAQAPIPLAYEEGRTRGLFAIVGDHCASGTKVYFRMTGTATAIGNPDYVMSPVDCQGNLCSTIFMPDGAGQSWIGLWPYDDHEVEGEESVDLTLQPNHGYNMGVARATMNIIDNDSNPPTPPHFAVTADQSSVNVGQCTTVRLDIIDNVTNCVAIGGVAGDGWAGVSTAVAMNRQVCPTGLFVNYGWHCTAPSGVEAEQLTMISVVQPQQCSIALTSNGTNFVVGAQVDLDASVTCTMGGASRVEFKQANSVICNDQAAPFHCDWDTAPVGSYNVYAVALGANNTVLATSAMLPINVFATQNEVPCDWAGSFLFPNTWAQVQTVEKWKIEAGQQNGPAYLVGNPTLSFNMPGVGEVRYYAGGRLSCAMTAHNGAGQSLHIDVGTGKWDHLLDHEVDRWFISGCDDMWGHPQNMPEKGTTWDRNCRGSIQAVSNPNANQQVFKVVAQMVEAQQQSPWAQAMQKAGMPIHVTLSWQQQIVLQAMLQN